jgi:hypothetical protein
MFPMNLSRLAVLALFAAVAVQASDYVVPSATKKTSKTYYSYSYKPTGGTTVHASGFHQGGSGLHWNHSTVSSGSSTISNWKSKANSAASNAASKLSSSVQLPTIK